MCNQKVTKTESVTTYGLDNVYLQIFKDHTQLYLYTAGASLAQRFYSYSDDDFVNMYKVLKEYLKDKNLI